MGLSQKVAFLRQLNDALYNISVSNFTLNKQVTDKVEIWVILSKSSLYLAIDANYNLH